MKWNVCWLPDDDKNDGSGWLSVEILYPSPEYRGAPDVLLAARTRALRRQPADVKNHPLVADMQNKILERLYAGLYKLNSQIPDNGEQVEND
jgi:hypothetical protein